MTLEQLRIFVAVAEREHITRAAQALNLTQSSVSAAIAALEARHGVRLFDRVGRAVVLNRAGGMFLKEAKAVLRKAGEAEAVLSDLAGLQRGRIDLVASQTIGTHWLPARLVSFHRRYPGIVLDIQIANTFDAAAAVTSGAAELGLVEGAVDRPSLTSEVFATDEMIMVVAAGHRWARTPPRPGPELAASSWILREFGSGTRGVFDAILAQYGVADRSIDVSLVLPSNEAVLSAVQSSSAATLTSRVAAATYLAAGRLAQVRFPVVERPFYLLRHQDRYRSAAVEALREMLMRGDNHSENSNGS